MAYVPAEGECGTITVDKVPADLQDGDLITRIDSESVVMRTRRGLFVATNLTPDILDAEVIE